MGGILPLILTIQPRGTPMALLPPPPPGLLHIHVAGAVRGPGVYPMPVGPGVE
jgi:hypothetical protein